MPSVNRIEANRRDARGSTGPRTEAGALACRDNALRHGLRAQQVVIPGEDPAAWAALKGAVEADLAPSGAVESALADLVAAKLWRLGRVARHEADLIANAQHRDEVLRAHERANERGGLMPREVGRSDIPTRHDVEKAKRTATKAAAALASLDEVIRLLEALPGMADDEAFADWNPLYEAIKAGLVIAERPLERLFEGVDNDSPFLARHARMMLATYDDAEGGRVILLRGCRQERPAQESKAVVLQAEARRVVRRYRSALERRRLAAGLPGGKDLEKIQRYEAHLERGLFKALDRIRDLKECRGASPSRGPALALAVVQSGGGAPPGGPLGQFGTFCDEATPLAAGS